MLRRFPESLLLATLCLALTGSFARAQSDSSTSLEHSYQTTFSLTPALGLTLQSESEDDKDVLSAQWLASLQSKLFKDGEPFQLGAQLYAKYGQSHSENEEPRKTQDDLILSVTPSMTVLPGAGIRLFLEITGETQFRKGLVDTVETNFLDPLFLYQMLFLGKRVSSTSEDGNSSFDLTAGVGYALQQTLAQKFILAQNRNFVVTENSPLSSVQDNVTIEAGYAAMFDVNYESDLSGGLVFRTGWKTVAMTKESFKDLTNARVTSLLTLGLSYKLLSLDYSNHLVFDRSISLRRQLEQSLVFGVKVKL